MRSNTDIFTVLVAPHTARVVQGFDSALNTGCCAIGYIQGQYRTLNAIVTESASELDHWHIVNLKGGTDIKPKFDSVAVLGVVDDEQASDLAILHFGRMFDAAMVDVIHTNQDGLMRHLATPHFHKSQGIIPAWQLEQLQDVISGVVPQWDDINLVSHNGSTAHLLLDMQRHDDHGGLLEKFDGLPKLLEFLGAVQSEFDSIVTRYQYMEVDMMRLHKELQDASKGGVQVETIQESKPFEISNPFRHKKVLNVAVYYNFNDGQSLTVIFHHPDREAKKIAPDDNLVSWKILINNRDVTGAIQPNQGGGLKFKVLAVRAMKLINQNSSRFKRTQSKKAENVQALADATQRIEEKKAQALMLDNEIADLLNQIDALAPSNASSAPVFENDATERATTLPDEQNRLSTKYPILDKFVKIAKDRGYSASIGWGGGSAHLSMAGRNLPLTVSLNVSPRLGLDTDQDVGKITIAFWQNDKSDYEYIEEFDATEANIIPAFEEAEKYIAGIQTSKPKIVTKKEAETVYRTLSDRHGWLTGGTNDEFLQQNYPGSIGEELANAKALLERSFNKVAANQVKANLETLIQRVEETITRWSEGQNTSTDDETIPQADLDFLNTIDANPIAGLESGNFVRVYNITLEIKNLGDEESESMVTNIIQKMAGELKGIAVEKGVAVDVINSTDPDDLIGVLDAMDELQKQIDQGTGTPVSGTENQSDIDYLNSIIGGQIDFTDGEAIENRLEEIGERLTAETEALFEQAVTTYTDYQVKQAASI